MLLINQEVLGLWHFFFYLVTFVLSDQQVRAATLVIVGGQPAGVRSFHHAGGPASLYLLIHPTSLTAASSYLVFKAPCFISHYSRKANRTLSLKFFSYSQKPKQCCIVIVLWLIKLYLHKEGNRTCLKTNLQIKLQSEQPLRNPRVVFF